MTPPQPPATPGGLRLVTGPDGFPPWLPSSSAAGRSSAPPPRPRRRQAQAGRATPSSSTSSAPASPRSPIRSRRSPSAPLRWRAKRASTSRLPDGVSWRAGRACSPHFADYVVALPQLAEAGAGAGRRAVHPLRAAEPGPARLPRRPHHRDAALAGAPGRVRAGRRRAAPRCAGLTGLLSSVIDLEPHQVEVVRRVLQDPAALPPGRRGGPRRRPSRRASSSASTCSTARPTTAS